MKFRKTTQAKFPLSEALSVILPTEQETWLLSACLHSGESGRRAWQIWQEQVGNIIELIRDKSWSIKWLLPLLFAALRRNAVQVDKTLLTHLRMASLKEELRTNTYRRIFHDVLSKFSSAGISAIDLRGLALANTVYDRPALRHCHDISLLLRNVEDISRAVELLTSVGFIRISKGVNTGLENTIFEHKSGVHLSLQCNLFQVAYYRVAMDDVWARSQPHNIGGVETRILSPADNLVHVSGHAAYSESRNSLRWVCDSWFIVDRYPKLEWEVFLDCAHQSNLALPLSVMLRYLADELLASIPLEISERLQGAAARTNWIGRDTLLHGARTTRGGGFASLLTMSGKRRVRAHMLMSWLVPSPSYLRWAHGVPSSWLLPFYYIYRPLRYSLNRIWLLVKSCLRISSLRRFRMDPRINS